MPTDALASVYSSTTSSTSTSSSSSSSSPLSAAPDASLDFGDRRHDTRWLWDYLFVVWGISTPWRQSVAHLYGIGGWTLPFSGKCQAIITKTAHEAVGHTTPFTVAGGNGSPIESRRTGEDEQFATVQRPGGRRTQVLLQLYRETVTFFRCDESIGSPICWKIRKYTNYKSDVGHCANDDAIRKMCRILLAVTILYVTSI